jgi:CheY-like chemotaxis protein
MASPPGRNVAVLVVEDEYLIRMDTSSSLEAAGFIVYEAENAADAIPRLSFTMKSDLSSPT